MARFYWPFVALAFAVFGLAAAFGQDARNARIRGTIASVDGTALVIAPNDGTAKITIHIVPSAKILVAAKASFVDITPGTYVGISNTGPNGLQDALEIHIFPRSMRGVREGQTPWDIGHHSRMTNGTAGAKVESYDGQNLTLAFNGGETTIQVRPNTSVVRLAIGTRADLKAGCIVFIESATSGAAGLMETDDIIVGRDGARPAM